MLLDLRSLEGEKTYTPTGGIVFAGTSPLVIIKTAVLSADVSITFDGTGPHSLGRVYIVSGGIIFDGNGFSVFVPFSGGAVSNLRYVRIRRRR